MPLEKKNAIVHGAGGGAPDGPAGVGSHPPPEQGLGCRGDARDGSTGPADEGWTRSAARAPRTRLYNIATNACLDSLRSRRRRVPSLHSMAEVPWLQPYPDRLLVGRRQPTAASYLRAPGDTEFRAFKFDVLRIEGGRIAEITTFDASLFPELGLPPTL